ncbi:MAG: riboflavin synthase [Eubacterium sp.]|nr:riboflavin synthase [Eubacterium sp.]
MFTGIVEEVGKIKNISICGNSGQVAIYASKVLEGTQIGDSIAVNGVCLTVTSLQPDGFTADIMAETVRRSSFSIAKNGDKVNLERAMPADGRFGGHIVSGHIDGIGTITDFRKEENAVWVTIKASQKILQLIIEKGSICIDGISLTVAMVSDGEFQVSVIPHTGEETTLLKKKPRDMVNLENDVIGKYVQKLLGINTEVQGNQEQGITMEFLEKYGI